MECVSCDGGYNLLDGEPVALSALKQSEATSVQPRSGRLSESSQTALATPPPLTSTSASEQSIDIISEKIGHKLLQGWCILSEVCESVSCHGSVPLMKDSKGRVSRYHVLSLQTLYNLVYIPFARPFVLSAAIPVPIPLQLLQQPPSLPYSHDPRHHCHSHHRSRHPATP